MVSPRQKRAQAGRRRVVMSAAHRARLLQLPLLAVVPAAFVAMMAVTLAPGYDVDPWPTLWVPIVLVLVPALALALSWNWHRKLRPTGFDDSWHFYADYASRLRWLVRPPLFVLLPVEGAVLAIVGAALHGDVHTVLEGAGSACVASATLGAFAWMLGSWVVVLEGMGEGLADAADTRHALSRTERRLLAAGPAGLMVGAILVAIGAGVRVEQVNGVPWAIAGVVVMAVALVDTFVVGLKAGHHPPGQHDVRLRILWVLLVVVGAIGAYSRWHYLWNKG